MILTMSSEEKKLQKAELREFEAKLIMEVKSHICLYAKDDPGYSNKNKRQEAWADISSVLGKSTEECQKKWTSLRDSFRTYLRMETNVPSGSGATAPIKWIHFQSLRFLIPYCKVPADDCGNFTEELLIMEASPTITLNASEEVEVVVDVDDTITAASGSRQQKKTKKRKAAADEPFERVFHAIENSQQPKKKPIEHFFDGVVEQIQHFSAPRMINFQQSILTLLAQELANDFF